MSVSGRALLDTISNQGLTRDRMKSGPIRVCSWGSLLGVIIEGDSGVCVFT